MAIQQKNDRSTDEDEERDSGARDDEPEGAPIAELASDAEPEGELREAAPLATRDADEGEVAATQLGTNRYVMVGFFVAGILAAYVLGRAIQGVWSNLSNKVWFSNALPALAAVSDDDKSTYGTILGALLALVLVVRAVRRPDLRAWTDEVAGELAKVKWPSRKEVSSYTIVVIAASAVATAYLALLDRFWAFITNLVYGGNGT